MITLLSSLVSGWCNERKIENIFVKSFVLKAVISSYRHFINLIQVYNGSSIIQCMNLEKMTSSLWRDVKFPIYMFSDCKILWLLLDVYPATVQYAIYVHGRGKNWNKGKRGIGPEVSRYPVIDVHCSRPNFWTGSLLEDNVRRVLQQGCIKITSLKTKLIIFHKKLCMHSTIL